MREIQSKTTEFEKHLQSGIDNKNQEKINIECAINKKLQDIMMVDKFGSIKVNTNPSINIVLKKGKQKRLNAVDYTIPFDEPYSTFDVVSLKDSTVAISTGSTHYKCGISIVDLTKRKVIKFIDLPKSSYGITYDGKSLICCIIEKNLHVVSCTDYSITTIPNTLSSRFSHISTHDDKIFVTNPYDQTVTCCLYSGALVWKFEDKRILSDPRGITVDNKGNVFVTGKNSCNVVVISPDGKYCKQILTKGDGLDRPIGIFFDKRRNQLLVTNKEQFAYVFNVSYT
ncbi:TRIM2_3 [Mytilus edulis]|uniref:TRIM2_3 n=1 Tax=Mytilus edulis TaxID=6550 RepID=A0A8S3T8E7_MYTED|nr:TRIM2_3 [Mytilus edulis]